MGIPSRSETERNALGPFLGPLPLRCMHRTGTSCDSLFPSPKRCLSMLLEADRPVALSLLVTFTHYLHECDPYHKRI